MSMEVLATQTQQLMRDPTSCVPDYFNDVPKNEAWFWYEEETIDEGIEEDDEYTEVTYESDCPTEEEVLLLEMLPPAPPLADADDLEERDEAKEQRLLEALKKKRDDAALLISNKDTTSQPRCKAVDKMSAQPDPGKTPGKHCPSPTFVGENVPVLDCRPRSETGNIRKCSNNKTVVSPRLRNIDCILQRQVDRRRNLVLPSGNPRQQQMSLHKVWKQEIDRQMEALAWEMALLENGLARITEPNTKKEMHPKKNDDACSMNLESGHTVGM